MNPVIAQLSKERKTYLNLALTSRTQPHRVGSSKTLGPGLRYYDSPFPLVYAKMGK